MKQTTKILILMIIVAIIGIGIPTTFSIGSGQHQFRQIDPADPDAFCTKCHGANDGIEGELAASGQGIYSQMKIHQTLKCADCHTLIQGYGTSTPSGTKTNHAATIPTCLKCHSGANSTMGYDVKAELNSASEAHKKFDDEAACIGCHTSVVVSGTVSYTYSNGVNRFGLKIGK